MSTKAQHLKKNSNRLKSKELGYYSSIQRNYGKRKEENKNQIKLF